MKKSDKMFKTKILLEENLRFLTLCIFFVWYIHVMSWGIFSYLAFYSQDIFSLCSSNAWTFCWKKNLEAITLLILEEDIPWVFFFFFFLNEID